VLAPETQRVLGALADPTRVVILDALAREPSGVVALSQALPITRQGTAKHVAVLRAAGLVHGRRIGREALYEVQTEPLQRAVAQMASAVSAWDHQLRLLKRAAERPAE